MTLVLVVDPNSNDLDVPSRVVHRGEQWYTNNGLVKCRNRYQGCVFVSMSEHVLSPSENPVADIGFGFQNPGFASFSATREVLKLFSIGVCCPGARKHEVCAVELLVQLATPAQDLRKMLCSFSLDFARGMRIRVRADASIAEGLPHGNRIKVP